MQLFLSSQTWLFLILYSICCCCQPSIDLRGHRETASNWSNKIYSVLQQYRPHCNRVYLSSGKRLNILLEPFGRYSWHDWGEEGQKEPRWLQPAVTERRVWYLTCASSHNNIQTPSLKTGKLEVRVEKAGTDLKECAQPCKRKTGNNQNTWSEQADFYVTAYQELKHLLTLQKSKDFCGKDATLN